MLSHEKVWTAIDELAFHHGLSTSGLARRAGLDPTTFNRSKRVAGDGRPRWPSTESLAKILEATGEELEAFAARIKTSGMVPRLPDNIVPQLAIQAPVLPSGLEPGNPLRKITWDEQRFPKQKSANDFAVAVSGNGFLPIFREGDIIIAERGAPLRVDDRLLVQKLDSPLAVYTLVKRYSDYLELRTIEGEPQSNSIEHSAIEWTARIIWASQ